MKEIQKIKNDIMLLKNLGNIPKEVELVLLRKLTSLEKQLTIGGVVKSLPNKEECILFLNERLEQVSEECGESDLKRTLLFGFDRGFKEAFNWFKTR